jgi:hypothetical protein
VERSLQTGGPSEQGTSESNGLVGAAVGGADRDMDPSGAITGTRHAGPVDWMVMEYVYILKSLCLPASRLIILLLFLCVILSTFARFPPYFVLQITGNFQSSPKAFIVILSLLQ